MAAWAKGHFGGMREHALQYAEQTGTDIETALLKFGLEEPEIPPGFEFVWEWFFEISAARTSSGFGWNPLSLADIAAWGKISGVKIAPWLLKCFLAMDHEWLRAAAEEQKKKNKVEGTKK